MINSSKMHIYPTALAILMKILVEAYGCSLNHGEAEEFMDGLLGMGHETIEDQGIADAFILFTCGVIETTERHMLKRIAELATFPEKKMMVCGCLPNISPEKILKIAPHAKLVSTGQHMGGLAYFSTGVLAQGHRNSYIGILPISSGCLGTCSYCITMTARGSLHSKSIEELTSRLEHLISNGAVEIQLCAQDTAVYGADTGKNLAQLVQTLGSVEGDFMMRVGMMNPANVIQNLEPIIRAFKSPKVFKFLHLPVQSGSDAILENMNRHHTVEEFEVLVRTLRENFPELSFSTDIIVGFPGETDEDFQSSLGLVKRIKPDIVNITRFSSRPGTEAHAMEDKVPGRIAKDRSRVMTDLRFSITGDKYLGFKGRKLRALATERRIEGSTFLRTLNYRPIVIDEVIDLGKWYDIEITGHAKTHLTGNLL